MKTRFGMYNYKKSILKPVKESQNQPYDWSGELVPNQGFGFHTNCVNEEMKKRFQVNVLNYKSVSICQHLIIRYNLSLCDSIQNDLCWQFL